MATHPRRLEDTASDWTWAEQALNQDGYLVLPSVLRPSEISATIKAMEKVQQAIIRHVGAARLDAAGEAGVLRLMMRFDPFFFRFLSHPVLVEAVDALLSPTAILHLQNGFILPPTDAEQADLFQRRWHQDFPRLLNGFRASLNVMIALSDFTKESGATLALPGSHQQSRPSDAHLDRGVVSLTAPAGSFLIFDSTLWHCAGANQSGEPRLAINHQFTHAWMKPQIDYVRALGEAAVLSLPARTQQLLGYYSRVPTSLDEYYRPPDQRLYRSGQG